MTPMVLAVAALTLVYASGVTAFLALQNRSPQSTLAWVLLFVVFPPAVPLTYIMFGRRRHAFSRDLNENGGGTQRPCQQRSGEA